MKKVGFVFLYLALISLGVPSLSLNQKAVVPVNGEFAPEGMVAYAASYSSNITNEPKYATQNSTTFQYLNLGTTLNTYRGDSVKVGIIDSGINYDHEDFMVSGSTKVKGSSKYYSYQSSQWVYYGASSHGYSYIDDTLGHGTNVAATVAAAVNSVGGLGLAPNVELYIYKVTNSNNGYEFGAIQNALMDAKILGLDVLNMSFQSYEHAVSYGSSSMAASSGCSSILSYYLNQAYNAGITLVGAAGNYNTSEPSYPGSNNHVINVGSLNSTGTGKAPFSNYGSTIDLVAPGYVYVADESSNTAYTNTQGTSFSAPLVTAAIALYKQKNPSATPAQIEAALYASCDEIDDSGSQYTNWAGNGSLNVARFLGIAEDAPSDIVINNPEVENEELNLEIGDTFDIDWTVNGIGTFDNSVNFYTLGNNGTISVDSNGQITALKEGSDYVIIESNVDPNVYTQIYVTVISSGSTTPIVHTVDVSPATLNLDLNGTKTRTLTATVSGLNNPAQTVTWTSSDSTKATVSSSGLVTAKATGTVTITATSTVDQSKSGKCTVTITDSTVHVTGVSLNKSTTSIFVGSTETLVATVSPNNATNKNVTWSSSNTNVATVSGGTVTAVNTGSAVITVTTTDGSYQATCTVSVSAAQTQTLVITRDSFSSTSGNYAWYDWSEETSDNTTITGKAELYTSTTDSMQFNKGKGGQNAAIFNTVAIPGSITKIEAATASGTNRTWNAYVSSTAYSLSGSSMVSGSDSTKLNSSAVTVTTTSTTIGTSNHGYNYFCIQETVSNASYISEFKITYTPKSVSSIFVKTAPSKLVYEAGDYFDPTGLVITKTFSDSTTQDVSYAQNSENFAFSPSTSAELTTSDTSIIITHSGKTTTQAITVNPAKTLTSISVSGQTETFVEGGTFVFGGTVTAHFDNSLSMDVTDDAVFEGYSLTSPGGQMVAVSYTYKGKTESTTYSINVQQGTLDSISVTGQTTSYIKNHAFSFDGTCKATFENGYQKVVTPTSVSTPDMTTAGDKTITVSYFYNGVSKETTYTINVSSDRVVYEDSTTTGYSVVGTITYPNNKETISSDTLSVTTGGFTEVGDNVIRLGSSGNTGSITVTSTTSNITKVVVSAKSYGTDTSVKLSVGGTESTITSSYATYTKEYSTVTNSCTIATVANKKRAYIQSVTVYETKSTTVKVDISSTADCVGLESFIDTCLHMSYVENLGYCKDSEHHYYSTAKTAFNALNSHQRTLFTTNEAYAYEWARLSAWADANNESLNQNNILGANKNVLPLLVTSESGKTMITVLVFSLIGFSSIGGYLFIRRKREE